MDWRGNEIITCIIANNILYNFTNVKAQRIWVTAGGVGDHFVTFNMTSGEGHPLTFEISLYGQKNFTYVKLEKKKKRLSNRLNI